MGTVLGVRDAISEKALTGSKLADIQPQLFYTFYTNTFYSSFRRSFPWVCQFAISASNSGSGQQSAAAGYWLFGAMEAEEMGDRRIRAVWEAGH